MLKLSPHVTWRDLDGEIVLLENSTWRYLGVNASGTLLWQALADGTSREDLVSQLVAEYDLDTATAGSDVDAFVASLAQNGLLATPDAA
jgi:Coenzyme PQQ synthesis protein D (PqqD)